MPDRPTRTRLSKPDRRAQLLDAATRLLVERGETAMTMERLAEYAGVSKALPYAHFDNSDEVLVAVYQRVVTELGRRVLDAVEQAPPGADRIGAIVHAYFDAVRAQGPILRVVSAPGSRSSELARTDREVGVRFTARILREDLGVEPARALAAAPVVQAALTGAVTAWGDGGASRELAEQVATDALRGVVDGS